MDILEYSNIAQRLLQHVLENRGINAERTLKYCKDIIEYGQCNHDDKLIGFGYYYSGETYYGLNDGNHFFEAMSKALSYLNQAEEWDLMVRCYNYLGIAAMNRGNVPIALDYYLNGLNYCKTYHIPDINVVFLVNLGMLYIECERYSDAEETLDKAYDCMKFAEKKDTYHRYMFGIYGNLIKTLVLQNKMERVDELLERVHKDHWEYGDVLDKLQICCVEILYYHSIGKATQRDESIRMLNEIMPENLTVLDIFNDFYTCCLVLLDAEQDEAFWNILEILEPMVRNFNIINLQLKLLSLKMRFYRTRNKGAEYLQAAGLYFEMSELMENENRNMVNAMISLRKNLEVVDRARVKAEKENRILQERSEVDPLTKIANRFRLNSYSENLFAKALKDKIPLAVEILDVDYFKELNDNYGHQQGDHCLSEIARVIRELAENNNGFCARYGGDEFVIIYEGVSHEKAILLACALRKNVLDLELEHRYSKALPIVSISQGLCWGIPQEENKMWDFLHAADNMLYKVKKLCRNNYCVGDINESDNVVIGSPK